MARLQPDREIDTAPVRMLTPRQEDGLVYKLMGFVAFVILGLPIGYALTRGWAAPSAVKLLVAFFAFDVGWDLAVRAAGRGNLLAAGTSPRFIVARALERTADIGLVVMFFWLEGEARIIVGVVLVAQFISTCLSWRGPGWPVLASEARRRSEAPPESATSS